ncbi:hypothetical protein [Bradyrhizobium genosp. P]|uniref:hypothetical protein n=1 Tax=Bradyrhizobium genosp. P TaxID=83641 RepID=UPI003CE98D83
MFEPIRFFPSPSMGFNPRLESIPLNGAEIVIREVSDAAQSDDRGAPERFLTLAALSHGKPIKAKTVHASWSLPLRLHLGVPKNLVWVDGVTETRKLVE